MAIIDMSQVEVTERSGTFEPLENGEYNAAIFNIEKRNSAAGNDYLNFEFKLTDNNRRLWDRYSVVPTAIWKLKTLLLDLGLAPEEVEQPFESTEELLAFLEDKIVGTEVIVTVGTENYEGKDRNCVNRVGPMTEHGARNSDEPAQISF